MANVDNDCANLAHKNIKVDDKALEALQKIFDRQLILETRLGYFFEKMTIAQVADFLIYNQHCLTDEFGELLDALGGIKDGIGNAGWKKWKKDNDKAHSMKLKDLSESDLVNLKYEYVDKLHFFINAGLAIGITAKEMFQMYIAKNDENHARQDRNY